MTVTYQQIRGWDVAAVETFASAMTARCSSLEWLEEDLRRARQWQTWTGEGADAAAAGISRIGDLVTDVAASAQAAKNTAIRLANGVAHLQEHVTNADAVAGTYGFLISSDGSVTDLKGPEVTALGGEAAAEADRRADARRNLEQAVHDILRKGRELESVAASELRRVAAEGISDGGANSVSDAVDSQSAVSIPDPGTSPAAVAAWWSSLADPELAAEGQLSDAQKELLANHADVIGPLVGVPVEYRDEANRVILGDQLDQLDSERRSLEARLERLSGPMMTDSQMADFSDAHDRLQEVDYRLKDLNAVSEQLQTQQDLYLMQINALGDERSTAVVAVGDPDESTHVAITTPGFTTTVRGTVGGMVPEAIDLREDAQFINGGESTATIAFLGYQAPQHVDVLTNARAVDGAAVLAQEIEGIAVTNDRPENLHMTALGHSYGSNVTGIALQQLHEQGRSPVDDVVLYGSPGVMEVRDPDQTRQTPSPVGTGAFPFPAASVADPPTLDQMGIDPGRGYHLNVPTDPVSNELAGHLGPTPDEWKMTELSTEAGMTPGTAHWPSEYRAAPPQDGHEHSSYTKQEFMSQYNLAAVVAGVPRAVVAR